MERNEDQVLVLEAIETVRKELEAAYRSDTPWSTIKDILTRLNVLYSLLNVAELKCTRKAA